MSIPSFQEYLRTAKSNKLADNLFFYLKIPFTEAVDIVEKNGYKEYESNSDLKALLPDAKHCKKNNSYIEVLDIERDFPHHIPIIESNYDFSPVSAISIIYNIGTHRKKAIEECIDMITSAEIESIFVDMNSPELLAKYDPKTK
ncbi:MAG: hypothetical protein V1870_04640 [Candidatus Aenigmatarchaeota archaeon]